MPYMLAARVSNSAYERSIFSFWSISHEYILPYMEQTWCQRMWMCDKFFIENLLEDFPKGY